MTQSFDYYQEAKEIAGLLKRNGERKWADKIIESIEAGATGTEILMGVRWNIQECLKTRRTKMEYLDKRMLSFVARLDRVLS